MTRIEKAGRRRLTFAATLAAVAVTLLASFAIAARPGAEVSRGGDGSACKRAEEPSVGVTVAKLRESIRCLVNERRATRGARPVAESKNLQKAAQSHTRRMVRTGCLAHRCGDEPNLEERVRDSGYLNGASRWQFAESTGCGLSAKAMVANWMAIQFHRVNILEKKFRDVGIGVVQRRTPGQCSAGYSTFTLVLGYRQH